MHHKLTKKRDFCHSTSIHQAIRQKKNPLLVLVPLIAWSLLAFGVILPQASHLDSSLSIKVLAAGCGTIWWVIVLWTLHHLTFQIVAVFFRSSDHMARSPDRTLPIAVLYTTCDDFDAACCQSCLDQDYAALHLYICDDSRLVENQRLVDAFAARRPTHATVVRRSGRRGFKAGNVNHAIERVIEQEWVLLVDADQFLPPDYVSALTCCLPDDTTRVAFVQAAHQSITRPEDNRFQHIMASSVALYYQRNLTHRERCGFMPLLGHGTLIRRTAWAQVGGFPEVVSEDFAFALRTAEQHLAGLYAPGVTSYESFPHDFGGFVLRLKKYTGGAAELFRCEMPRFLFGRATLVEKWDALMHLIWYLVMPLIAVNSVLTAYVAHQLNLRDTFNPHPVLPYLYLWILFFTFTVELSLIRGWRDAARYYFWSTAIHTAIMPLLMVKFLQHLVMKPRFEPTPKHGTQTPVTLPEGLVMVALGVAGAAMGYVWYSPFSLVLWGHAIAYASYPVYEHLTVLSARGRFARWIVYLPGLFMLAGIATAWYSIYAR